MSTDRTLNGTHPAVVSTSDPDGIPSTGDSLTAERTERRRQRTAIRQARTASKPRTARRRDPKTESTSALAPAPLTLRDSVSVTSIAVLAAGGVVGAILGALSAAGWVIGLLVAALAVILSAVLRRYSTVARERP
ncbi:MAG TPA: hypothetical protein VFI54_12585 [Solirubrobacteraceae bacterium]|nr:hypothetical protein [Solirubrobacteraceae bacterium]